MWRSWPEESGRRTFRWLWGIVRRKMIFKSGKGERLEEGEKDKSGIRWMRGEGVDPLEFGRKIRIYTTTNNLLIINRKKERGVRE